MGEPILNFHHLHYFWAVATDGNLTRAAKRLRVAQSAVSAQIRLLEDQLGEPLFERGRTLRLTEAGHIALDYANQIFASGSELVATLRDGRKHEQVLRVGAVATLSRNFQESFIRPLLGQEGVRLRLESGGLDVLVQHLAHHQLDLVLSNRPPRRDAAEGLRCRRIARQMVSLVGRKRRRAFTFPDDLAEVSLILPGRESDIRSEFDAMCEQLGLTVRVLAEVDDMATMRLLVRDTDAVALLPSVVVRDELKARTLHEYGVVRGLFETFYAITVARQFPHPLLRGLLSRDEDDLLAMHGQK